MCWNRPQQESKGMEKTRRIQRGISGELAGKIGDSLWSALNGTLAGGRALVGSRNSSPAVLIQSRIGAD